MILVWLTSSRPSGPSDGQFQLQPVPYSDVVVDDFLDVCMMTLVSQSCPGTDEMEVMPMKRMPNAWPAGTRQCFASGQGC